MTSSLNILITGSKSGLGRLMAETLARHGHHVIASMRDVATRNAGAAGELRGFTADGGGSIRTVEIDAASDESVERGVKDALELTGGRIDVAINNAGLGTFGLTEGFVAAQLHALFNLNVCGAQRVNRAVLPGMRARGAGLLIHITSAIGRMVMPTMGPYCASKFALEALAEAYRYELSGTGVDSTIIEPGAYPTDFLTGALLPGDPSRAPGYGPLSQLPEQLGAGLGAMLKGPNAPNPQLVADAVAKLIATPVGQRPLRTVVDMHPEGVEAINRVCEQVQAGTLGAMGLGGLAQVAVREQAS